MDNRLCFTLLLTAAAACTGADAETLTRAEGQARYHDAATDADGNSHPPARPAPQPASDPMMVEVVLDGQAEMSGLDPECELDALSGSFDGWLAGEAALDDGGAYVASMTAGQAVFETPGGCTIPEIEILAVTSARVRATLSATEANCDGYCAARARAHAEQHCQAADDRAGCWASAAAEYQAACHSSCQLDSTRVIVAEAELTAAALASLDAEALEGALLGDIQVDLTFDHMEDLAGAPVTESP
jgi:hypothetical protein